MLTSLKNVSPTLVEVAGRSKLGMPDSADPAPAPDVEPRDPEVEDDGDDTDLPNTNVDDGADCCIESDDTPTVHSLTMTIKGTHTHIIARVFNPASGWQNKAATGPNPITAQQLATLVARVGSW